MPATLIPTIAHASSIDIPPACRAATSRSITQSSCVTARTLSPKDYTLAVLQLERDWSVRHYSEWKRMQPFVDHVESLYPHDRVIFRCHPKQPRVKLRTREPLSRRRCLWEDVLPARQVIGINSTALYESVLAGRPVTALGDCPLSRWKYNQRGIVLEIIRRQIPVDSETITDAQIHRCLGRLFA